MTDDASIPLLEAQNVTKAFGEVKALAGASLRLGPGELVGLVGADGAGKTSLIRALVGLIEVDGGTVRVDGRSWKETGPSGREALGYMPQQYSLYPDLSVDENLTFFASLFGLKRKVFEERREKLLGMAQLQSARDRPAGALSGGMYKKLAVACALLHRPRALVLDEPTNGVDPVSRRELWVLLYEFVADGMGVLLATPYMDEAARCGRVVLLAQGKVLAEGEPATLVAALAHPVIELDVPSHERSRVVSSLEEHRGVLSVTPAGQHLRAVLRREHADDVRRSLRGVRVRDARPDFEDLYLALVDRPQAGGAS
ncbi:ABC transporter ATP-binding protein [Pendulispora albinea]|uniref:ABC transporter ATP-binding protein n=1 Tax=Pendulispora albinea TaxID=2741071 RepID=A0ABZ2M143_9BACT